MQNNTPQPAFKLTIVPSRHYLILILISHATAAAALCLSLEKLWLLSALAVLLLQGYRHLAIAGWPVKYSKKSAGPLQRKSLWHFMDPLRKKTVLRQISLQGNNWLILPGALSDHKNTESMLEKASFLHSPLVTPYLTILSLRCNRTIYRTVLFYDSACPEVLRKLRIYLRYRLNYQPAEVK